MKSKVIKMTFWAFFAVIGSSTVYSYQQSVQLSDLLLINVEALADSEQTGSEGCVQDPNLVCVYPHPTDPTQDVVLTNARFVN